MNKIILALLLCLQPALFSSPFLTDLLPDYYRGAKAAELYEEGFYIYSGLDYSLIIEDEDTGNGYKTLNLSSGLMFVHEHFLFNTNWNGSMIQGNYTIEGFDQIFEDGDRSITTDEFLNGFQLDFIIDYFSFSLFLLDSKAFYNIWLKSPEIFGFYIGLDISKDPITALKVDLVKNYITDTYLLNDVLNPYFGWKNSFLNIKLGYFTDEYSFTEDKTEENFMKFNLSCSSTYGYNAELNLNFDLFNFNFSFEQSEYDFLITGRTDRTQFLYMENVKNEDQFLNLIHRKIHSDFSIFESKLQLSAFFESFHIPNDSNNRGYLDMAPLSPVGILYRRKDFLNNFGLFYQQAGGSLGTQWQLKKIGIGGKVNISYLAVNLVGDYHYIDGIISLFPIPHWTNPTMHDKKSLEETIEYLIIEPELSLSLTLGKFTLHSSVRQIIPLNIERQTDSDGSTESEPEQTEPLDIFGGFRASVSISYSF